MANQVLQGTLNRLRSSVTFADFQALNVTAPFLGREGISIAPEGDVSQQIGTMTGTVASPEPYQMVTVTIHMLRTQALSAAFKAQIETNAFVGSLNVISDSTTFPDYQIEEASIIGWDGMTNN